MLSCGFPVHWPYFRWGVLWENYLGGGGGWRSKNFFKLLPNLTLVDVEGLISGGIVS